VAEAKTAEPEVVFIGDSIIAQLEQSEVWKKWFVPFHCLNFGIGGDQTQHVLWRIQNGELSIIKPKVRRFPLNLLLLSHCLFLRNIVDLGTQAFVKLRHVVSRAAPRILFLI
jgi:hypothetical protein